MTDQYPGGVNSYLWFDPQQASRQQGSRFLQVGHRRLHETLAKFQKAWPLSLFDYRTNRGLWILQWQVLSFSSLALQTCLFQYHVRQLLRNLLVKQRLHLLGFLGAR
jgi:hypothetical protein